MKFELWTAAFCGSLQRLPTWIVQQHCLLQHGHGLHFKGVSEAWRT